MGTMCSEAHCSSWNGSCESTSAAEDPQRKPVGNFNEDVVGEKLVETDSCSWDAIDGAEGICIEFP